MAKLDLLQRVPSERFDRRQLLLIGAVLASCSSPSSSSPTNVRSRVRLRELIEDDYSYRDLRGIDWESRFAQYASALDEAPTARDFALAACELLGPAEDIHLRCVVGSETFMTHDFAATSNVNEQLLLRLVPQFWVEEPIASGHFEGNIGYILVRTWQEDSLIGKLETLLGMLAGLASSAGLVLDVRANSGGDELLASQFAGCFADSEVVYAKHRILSAGQWTEDLPRVLAPNPAGPKYRGRIAVLMGPRNVSTCESFLMMMRQVPGCALFGERSYGSLGNPREHRLENQVTLWIPSWQALKVDGSLLEGSGVFPDVTIPWVPRTSDTSDPVLAAALEWLRTSK